MRLLQRIAMPLACAFAVVAGSPTLCLADDLHNAFITARVTFQDTQTVRQIERNNVRSLRLDNQSLINLMLGRPPLDRSPPNLVLGIAFGCDSADNAQLVVFDRNLGRAALTIADLRDRDFIFRGKVSCPAGNSCEWVDTSFEGFLTLALRQLAFPGSNSIDGGELRLYVKGILNSDGCISRLSGSGSGKVKVMENGESRDVLVPTFTLTSGKRLGTFPAAYVVQQGFAPPVGWNTWYGFGTLGANEAIISNEVTSVNFRISNPLRYVTNFLISIDDGWQGPRVDGKPTWKPEAFPSGLPKLVEWLHSLGLKVSIYCEPRDISSAGFPSSGTNFVSDARIFAEWGFDGAKFDQIGFNDGGAVQNMAEFETAFREAAGGRQCWFETEYLPTDPKFISEMPPGTILRTTADWGYYNGGQQGYIAVFNNLMYMIRNGRSQYANPGAGIWVMPNNPFITDDPFTHSISGTWAMLCAPLIFTRVGQGITYTGIDTIGNGDLYAIQQDPLNFIATNILNSSEQMILVKMLSDGARAVEFLNTTTNTTQTMTLNWSDIGLSKNQPATIRDVWTENTIAIGRNSLTVTVPRMDCKIFRITPLLRPKPSAPRN